MAGGGHPKSGGGVGGKRTVRMNGKPAILFFKKLDLNEFEDFFL
jgi:hypothetical protein